MAEHITIHRRALLGAACVLPFVRTATAQAYPNRFVKLVVPFPPGGGTDGVARVLANRLSEMWGQQVVIENKGGAGTNIGTESVARSDPDGYTLLFQSMPIAVNRFLFPSLTYDSIADFAPVTLICDFPNIMAVPISSPAKSVKEFIDYANANKGKVTFASSGNGTSVHLAGELFKRMANIEMTHIPYRGAGPALNDLIPGRVDVTFNTSGAVLPSIQGGKLRGLAVTSAKRSAAAPELPPIAEAGVPGFDVSSWYAIFAPVKTPPEIVAKANADVIAAITNPVTKERLEQLGVVVVGSTPEGLAAHLKAEMDKWGPVIRDAAIKPSE